MHRFVMCMDDIQNLYYIFSKSVFSTPLENNIKPSDFMVIYIYIWLSKNVGHHGCPAMENLKKSIG